MSVRLTLCHSLVLSPLIKIEKFAPVYSVTIWVLLPSDNTIILPHDCENGALIYFPLRLYIPVPPIVFKSVPGSILPFVGKKGKSPPRSKK